MVFEGICRVLPVRTDSLVEALWRSNWEVGGFPGGEAAGDFGYTMEAGALEEAGGNGGAVAASAVDDDFVVSWEFIGFFHQMVERHAFAAVDIFVGAFAGIADIDHEGIAGTGHGFECVLWTEALCRRDEVGARVEAAQAVLQVADDVVEADATEANGGFFFAAGRRDDDDGIFSIENRSGPSGVLAAEADVDAAFEMSGGELGGIARVENLRVGGLQTQNCVERQRIQALFEGLIERGPLFAI